MRAMRSDVKVVEGEHGCGRFGVGTLCWLL